MKLGNPPGLELTFGAMWMPYLAKYCTPLPARDQEGWTDHTIQHWKQLKFTPALLHCYNTTLLCQNISLLKYPYVAVDEYTCV